MKRILLFLLVLLSFTGCDSGIQQTADHDLSLVGRWYLEQDNFRTEYIDIGDESTGWDFTIVMTNTNSYTWESLDNQVYIPDTGLGNNSSYSGNQLFFDGFLWIRDDTRATTLSNTRWHDNQNILTFSETDIYAIISGQAIYLGTFTTSGTDATITSANENLLPSGTYDFSTNIINGYTFSNQNVSDLNGASLYCQRTDVTISFAAATYTLSGGIAAVGYTLPNGVQPFSSGLTGNYVNTGTNLIFTSGPLSFSDGIIDNILYHKCDYRSGTDVLSSITFEFK